MLHLCFALAHCCAGAVELEKLPLKKDALRKLKLPFDIKSGEEHRHDGELINLVLLYMCE